MFGRKKANILVIKTDHLVGFVSAEPAFDSIRRAHPEAMISLLTTPALQRVARASPYFDQVAAMPNFRDNEARREFLKQLKSAKFERVYDLAVDEASKKLQGAMGIFGPKWFTASPAPRRRRGGADLAGALPSFDKLFSDAGLEPHGRLPDFHWALDARKDSANMKPSWYGISGAYGLLLPGPNPEGRWTAQGYAALAQTMSQSGFMPVLAGPKVLHDFADEIADTAPQLVDLAGKTDHLQLAALADEAAFFVSDHAEEMHLAVSVGCEGVLIASGAAADAAAPHGRHVVTLTSDTGPGSVDAAFVWRTLLNMGLAEHGQEIPVAAQSH
ncbi:MAG: glycosyltransferase family 9 protein [Pseudomonadota bacterium]